MGLEWESGMVRTEQTRPEILLKYPDQPLGDSTHPGNAPRDLAPFPRNRKQRNLLAKWVPELFLPCGPTRLGGWPPSTGSLSPARPQATVVENS